MDVAGQELAGRLSAIRERIAAAAIRSGRKPEDVKLVAVTKGVSSEKVRQAIELGVNAIGENRVQEARAKLPAVGRGPGVEWHMIGHLQTNKVRAALEIFDVIQSLDRWKLASELDAYGRKRGIPVNVLVQVKVSGEETKFGVHPSEVLDFVRRVAAELPGLRVLGLMAIAPYFDDPEKTRPYFRQVRELGSAVEEARIPGVTMRYISMGMTNDFEVAIEEGSNMVRIGTGIFGQRQ
ncbi:MAG TPA: YggS family pyridoxal phosphate-dependent enzyme [Firmicutes bacterium]|nr:YggS family pyridoxal phosphate-dependent enzyme [Bacillota bacterium]